MNCSACQHENRDSARFCAQCGERFETTCSNCGTPLRAGAKFCDECGAATGATSSSNRQSSPATPDRSPRDYTPKHLADKILQSKSALEGERKQVTVMFADVKGSMELAEQVGAEQWHTILDRFFAILTLGVHRFEGTVNQYTGDGIMALFGAPIAHEDHAQRACYAALSLLEGLREYGRTVRREHGLDFATRIGLHSGEVIVGKIGDDLRMDYTAQGQTVGLAQRIESLAEADACFLSERTATLAAGFFDLEDLGEFRLKGMSESLRVHRLAGAATARSRFEVALARGLSRFVGRATDVQTLENALAHTAAGHGQVVGVVAQAGTGKSRLCFEFLERCRARGMRVYEARAVAHGKDIPLLPILELFRAHFDITARDADRSAREKIAGRMVLLDPEFSETLPLLFDFLGVPDPGRPAPPLSPEARQRQLLAVMGQVVQNVSKTQPIVTMIEDLHWLDAASAEFLDRLVEAQGGSRHLLLLNFRPEFHANWMQKSWYRQIPLTPLGRDEIAELLVGRLGSDPSIEALIDPIHARTGGNPFFAEEVAQSLIESGQLEGERGAYRLTQPIEGLEVPATVQSVLAARIDRLPEREKRLLQVAAVIGKDFPEPLLAAVAEVSGEELRESLAALRRAEFIHEQALYPVAEYAFRHPLTQEVTLGSQLQERRRAVHAAVAKAIEQQDTEHLDERAALLAHHWEEAGDALPAARWHRRAADWVGRSDLAAATRHWQRVRALRREAPDDREAAALGIAACRQLLQNMTFRVAVAGDEARALLQEGQGLAGSLGDHRESLYLSMIYSRVLGGDDEVAAYLDLATQNWKAALEIDDLAAQTNAATYLIDAQHLCGRLAEVIALSESEIDRVPRLVPRTEWLWGFNHYPMIRFMHAAQLTWNGRLRDSIEEWGQVVRVSDEDGTPELSGFAWCYSAEAHYRAHDPERTLACAQRVEAISRERSENLGLFAHSQFALGYARLATGRAAEAADSARSALDLFRRVDKPHAGKAASFLAEARLEAGDLAAAQSSAEEAIALCRHSLRALYEAIAHGVLARALLRRDGAAARAPAEAALENAAALIEGTGARSLEPALCEWRAELAAVLGDDTTSSKLLHQAQQGYEAIGAPGHAARLAHKNA